MSGSWRPEWDERHRGQPPGEAAPFLVAMLARIPRGGVALDVAAGRGRNALALARAGMRVVAVDRSTEAIRTVAAAARSARLPIWPVVANLDSFQLKDESFDVIVNINFLDRALFPKFVRALRPGGILIADTFLVDQAAIGGHARSSSRGAQPDAAIARHSASATTERAALFNALPSQRARDPRFLLERGELRALADGLEIEEYYEGLIADSGADGAYRASMLARRRKSS